MRLTKIICTWGPASSTPESIEALAKAGMNIVRFNLSHGSWENHGKMLKIVDAINTKLAQAGGTPTCIATMLDTKGAEVRTSVVETPVVVQEGDLIVFSAKPLKNEKHPVVIVNHTAFSKDARDAENIIVDNGTIIFDIKEIRKDGGVVAKALQSGKIGSRRHVNLPGADLDMPSVSKEDWEYIDHAIDGKMDYIALSFIRTAKEVEEVRAHCQKRKSSIALYTKIETRQATENIKAIIDASDGIMVARGDLGSEIPFEQVPVWQDRIVELTRAAGKPVIVATHMLESMIVNPIPTRAEVTDIAHAAMTRTDMTMLSGETAGGAHPLTALKAMDRVLRETEKYIRHASPLEDMTIRSERDAQAAAAVSLAMSSDASAILVITKSGQTARDVSRFRPHMPIIAGTPDEWIQHALLPCFGIIPFVTSFSADPEKTVVHAVEQAKKAGVLKKGQRFVLLTDARAHAENVSTIQVRSA